MFKFKKRLMLNLLPFPVTVGLLQAPSHCYHSIREKALHLFSVQFRRKGTKRLWLTSKNTCYIGKAPVTLCQANVPLDGFLYNLS